MTDLTPDQPDFQKSLRELKTSCGEYLYRLDANTFVLEPLKLMYMDTPKTAGTSIKTRLAVLTGGATTFDDSYSRETAQEMFIHDRELNPLKAVTDFSNETQGEILFSNEWTRVCVVRNPFTRLFSAWFSKVLLRQPGYLQRLSGYQIANTFSSREEIYLAFESFVRHLQQHGVDSDPHWDQQNRLLFGEQLSWTKVFTYENLEAELLQASGLFGCDEFRIGSLNLSGMAPDWNAISESCKSSIAELYQTDFDIYGYPTIAPESHSPTELLPVYVNAVIGRNRRLTQLFERDDEKYQEIIQLKAELERNYSERNTLHSNLIQAREEGGVLRQQLEQATEQNQQIKEQNVELSGELESLINSNSWRLTAPLRKLRDLFRKTPV